MSETIDATPPKPAAIADAPLDGTPILGWWKGAWFPMRWESYPPNKSLWGWRILPWEGTEFLFFASPESFLPMPEAPTPTLQYEVRWRGHRHKWSAMLGETVLRDGMESREECEAYIRDHAVRKESQS